MRESPLMAAVKEGNFQKVKELLIGGSDPNQKWDKGLAPLHLASSRGHRDVAFILTSAGADVNIRDDFGRTPLHHAAVFGYESIVSLLLLREADPTVRAESGLSPDELALVAGHEDVARILYMASKAGNLAYARQLARSIATIPSNPSDSADGRIVAALLREKGVDAWYEPLIAALLREVRKEKPQPNRRPPIISPARHIEPSGSYSTRRAERFSGIPSEVVSPGASWVVVGSDASVLSSEVVTLEETGDVQWIMNMAVGELHGISIDTSMTALDLFNEYFRQNADPSEFRRTIEAALTLYTDSRFYRILNDRWREGRSRELIGFSSLMSMSFRHARYYMGSEAFRGVDLHDWHHYESGLVFRWPFFVSASSRIEVAAEFGETLVTIEVPGFANVREIDYCSLYPDEGEVLFRAYEVFEVVEADARGVRLRVFDDEWFGTGYEVSENRKFQAIE